jgi:hypothetical protein
MAFGNTYNNAFTNQNSFNTNLPTSTLTPTSDTQLTTKVYVDGQVASRNEILYAAAGNPLTTGTATGTGGGHDILSYDLAANTMSIGDRLDVKVTGHFVQNNATTQAVRFKFLAGGTTLLNSAIFSIAQSSAPYAFQYTISFVYTATGVQFTYAVMQIANNGSATAGSGSISGRKSTGYAHSTSSTLDMTSDQTFKVQGTFDSDGTGATFNAYHSEVKIIRAS